MGVICGMKPLSFLSALLLLLPISFAHNVTVYFFWGEGCPHCAEMKQFFSALQERYPIELVSLEVYYNDTNRELLYKFFDAYNVKIKAVPVVFIGNESFLGFSDVIADQIESKISYCTSYGCISPYDYVMSSVSPSSPSSSSSSHRSLLLFVGIAFVAIALVIYFLRG